VTKLTERYSLEITGKDREQFHASSKALPRASEVAITSLPSDLADDRVQTAIAVRKAGFIPVPHLAARRLKSAVEVNQLVDRLSEQASVDRFFVIAGDVREPLGPFPDALALIGSGALHRSSIAKIGIAGYPDGHPNISQDQLWRALRAKGDLLTAMRMPYEIVTQFSFDSDAILSWLKRLRDAGIAAPVKIGVPGPATIKSLLRFAAVCGVNASSKVVTKYGFSLASLLGHAGPDALLTDLEQKYQPSEHGDVRLHFYPFGGIAKTVEWIPGFRQRREVGEKTANPREAAGRT
jgi:methylenetetrahydrofolate reductase (NADPH)